MDLLTLNNFMVGLRKPIEKAKVQIIHKLTRQSVQLKQKKGSDEQKEKNQRKANRLGEEIRILSKLPKNAAARFAVQNTQRDLDEIINPEVMTEAEILQKLRKRALIRLSNHRLVLNPLSEFRAKHPEWNKEIDKALKVLGQKSKKKKEMIKKAKRKLEKQKKRMGKKKLDTGENEEAKPKGDKTQEELADAGGQDSDTDDENEMSDDENESSGDENEFPGDENAMSEDGNESSGDENEFPDDENEAEVGSDENDEVENQGDEKLFVDTLKSLIQNASESETDEDEIEKKNVKKSSKKNNVKDKGDKNQTKDAKGKQKKMSQQLKEKRAPKRKVLSEEDDYEEAIDPKKFSKREGSVLVKPISMSGGETSDSEGDSEEEETVNSKSTAIVKDSFFLGGQSNSESESDNDEAKTNHQGNSLGNRRTRRAMERSGEYKPKEFDSSFQGRGRGDFNRGRGDFNRGRGDFNRGRGDFNRGRGDFNRGRGDFSRGRGDFARGRDFTRGRGDFGRGRGRGDFVRGRGDGHLPMGRTQAYSENFEKRPIKEFNGSNSSEKIHPSWAARKEQQSGIQPFQGKKMRFDNDGESEATARPQTFKAESENSELHPSWAARKNQLMGIVPFQGNKKKFDEEPDQNFKPTQKYERKNFSFDNAKSQSENSKLHPSWAARKDQQKGIQPFQGKKMKFGEDDGADDKTGFNKNSESRQPKSENSKLHPSWAARKDQQKGIQAFQGKKIVFDE